MDFTTDLTTSYNALTNCPYNDQPISSYLRTMPRLATAETIELTPGNYHLWMPLARAELQRQSCFDVCEDDDGPSEPSNPTKDGTITSATSNADAAAIKRDYREEHKIWQEWKRRDAKAIGIITGSISIEQRAHVEKLKTAKACWDKLAEIHKDENTGFTSFYIAASIADKRYDPEEDIRDHISWLTTQNNRLPEDFKFSEEFLALFILMSLPRGEGSPWETQALLCLQSMSPTSKLTIANVTAKLTTEWLRQNPPESNNSSSALFAARTSTSKQSKTPNSIQKPECTFCGIKNHVEAECKKKIAAMEKVRADKKKSKTSRKAPATAAVAADTDTEADDEDFVSVKAALAASSPSYMAELDATRRTFVFISDATHALIAKAARDTMVVDSGCTRHISPRREWFSDFKPHSPHERVGVSLGDSSVIFSHGVGTLTLLANTPSGTREIKIPNVLYVPEMSATLISVAALTGTNRYKVVFDNNDCIVTHKSTSACCLVATKTSSSKLYVVQGKPLMSPEPLR